MTGFDDQLPEWAVALSNGELQVGVQLCTKDGRIVGNGFVIDVWDSELFDLWIVMTDAGNTMRLTTEELTGYFHIGKYVCSVDRIWKDFSREDRGQTYEQPN